MSATGYTTYGSLGSYELSKPKKALKIHSGVSTKGGRDRPQKHGPRGAGKESWLQLSHAPVKKEQAKAISFVDSFQTEEVSTEDEQLREATVEPNALHAIYLTHCDDG
jgi:hypothetical protein